MNRKYFIAYNTQDYDRPFMFDTMKQLIEYFGFPKSSCYRICNKGIKYNGYEIYSYKEELND
jgi:hypothetical protein